MSYDNLRFEERCGDGVAVATIDRPRARNTVDAATADELYDGLGRGIDEGLKIETWHGNRSMSTAVEGAERFAEGEGRGGEGL